MKKSIINKGLIGIMALLFSANYSYSQQGIGTNKPNKASVLDLKASSKGLLFPRVALLNTTNFQPLTGIPASELHTANSMIVYNTATSGSGVNAVTPGFYYWDKPSAASNGQWKRLTNETDIATRVLQGDVIGTLSTTKVEKIQNVPVSSVLPTNGQVLQYNGSQWSATALPSQTVTTSANGLSLNGTTVELGGNLSKNTIVNQNGKSLTLQTGGNTLSVSGLNKSTVQNNTDYLVTVGNDNVIKAVKATLPKFFYMPSMMLPLASDQIVPSMHTTFSGGVFTVDLHKVYAEQFGGTNSTNSTSNPSKTTSLPVLPNTELDYYITFYDPTVYTSVSVDNLGVLSYKIAPSADPNDGSFMNIIFAVKP